MEAEAAQKRQEAVRSAMEKQAALEALQRQKVMEELAHEKEVLAVTHARARVEGMMDAVAHPTVDGAVGARGGAPARANRRGSAPQSRRACLVRTLPSSGDRVRVPMSLCARVSSLHRLEEERKQQAAAEEKQRKEEEVRALTMRGACPVRAADRVA